MGDRQSVRCYNACTVGRDLKADELQYKIFLLFELKQKYWPVKHKHFCHSSKAKKTCDKILKVKF